MAIKQRSVFRSVLIEYINQPAVSFFVDGTEKLASTLLPSHSIRKTRRFYLPPGAIGNTGQLYINSTFTDIVDHKIESIPEETYKQNSIYHYYDIAFTGTVTLKLFLDEAEFNPNNGKVRTLTMSPRSSKTQDNRKVYFPALSYGYIPHIQQVIETTEDGQLISANPVALPPVYSKGLRTHSEFQVTYQGECNLEIFLDGTKIHEGFLPEQKIPQDGGYTTLKDYLPSGSEGHVLQWLQSDGDGDIALLETDMTMSDREQPNVSNPN